MLNENMGKEIFKEGEPILHVNYCKHHKEGEVERYAVDCNCRKPKPGMILQAIKDFDVDVEHSFLIGDSQRDVDAAEAAGVKGYLFTESNLLHFMKKILKH